MVRRPGRPSRPPAPGPNIRIPPAVAFALKANAGPRFLVGFLTMFMAFLLREQPVADLAPEVLLALVVGAAGAATPPASPWPRCCAT